MKSNNPTHHYKIGAIANLTGLSTHTIRAWERRYGMELSDRTDGGTRLYPKESLDRLLLLRKLLDHGESISVLSQLSVKQLEERLGQFGHPLFVQEAGSHLAECKKVSVAVLGNLQWAKSNYQLAEEKNVSIEFSSDNKQEFETYLAHHFHQLDACLLVCDFVNSDEVDHICSLSRKYSNSKWIVLFQLASNQHLQTFVEHQINAIRGPLPEGVLVHSISSMISSLTQNSSISIASIPQQNGSIFSSEQLAKLVNYSSAKSCDYTNHLTMLIQNLAVFEKFCDSCSETATNKYLNDKAKNEAGKSRYLLECLLKDIFESEGIKIDS